MVNICLSLSFHPVNSLLLSVRFSSGQLKRLLLSFRIVPFYKFPWRRWREVWAYPEKADPLVRIEKENKMLNPIATQDNYMRLWFARVCVCAGRSDTVCFAQKLVAA